MLSVPGWPETLLRLGARVVLGLGLRGALSAKRFGGVGRKGLSRRWEVLQREFAAGLETQEWGFTFEGERCRL